MKKYLQGLLILSVFFLTQSCMKEVFNDENQTPSNDFKDLKVSPTFDWVTSKNITCTVNSATSTPIEIYTDKACKEELLITLVAKQGSLEIPASIAQGTEELYLKYKTTAGTDKILAGEFINGTVVFSINDGAEVEKPVTRVTTIGIDDNDIPYEDHDGAYISYPAGWGTVMFEDLFPALGDYDLNDFVAGYQISVEFPWRSGEWIEGVEGEKGHYGPGYRDPLHANCVRVHLTLKALGGTLKFNPYVRIVGLKKDNVKMNNPAYGHDEYPNPNIKNDTDDKVQVELMDDSNGDVVVGYKNLNGKNEFSSFTSFYNTVQEETMPEKYTTEVWIYLELTEEVETASLLDDKIDIFLASEDRTKEIHLRGFNPAFSSYNYDEKGVNKNVTYASDKNLVWGLKVASRIGHAVERMNFLEVYPDFKLWAESEGKENKDWYKTNVKTDNLFEWSK